MSASLILLGGGTAARPPRRGVVRADGKAVRDDAGFFHPLGMTFFWAPQGWKFDNARFLKNLDWAAALPAPPDYLRVLGQVDWPGWEIDPNWLDYDEVMYNVFNAIHERGMRTELTMCGSPYNDPWSLAHRLSMIMRDHTDWFMDVETWNEWTQNGGSIGAMKDAAEIFLNESGVPLVALSSNIVNPDRVIADASAECGATLGTDHTDRDDGDFGWRMVRQGNGSKDTRLVYSANEPPGPNSSINVLENPLQLAMLRQTSVQSGGALFVLHVGDMVMGKEDPAHGRHPNLWEVDNLPALFAAVRGVDRFLPDGIENWTPTNQHGTTERVGPHPLLADGIWSDGDDHGVNRAYGAVSGNQFVESLLGVKGYVTLTADRPMTASAFDPVTGDVVSAVTLAPGQSWTLQGRDDTMVGYVVKGQW